MTTIIYLKDCVFVPAAEGFPCTGFANCGIMERQRERSGWTGDPPESNGGGTPGRTRAPPAVYAAGAAGKEYR